VRLSGPRVRGQVAVLVTAGLLAGCTGGAPQSGGRSDGSPAAATGSSGHTATPSPSATTATPAPPAPLTGACYLLSVTELTHRSSDSLPVSCRRRHTTRTIHVGRVAAGSGAATLTAVGRRAASRCPRELARYLGGSRRTRHLSRFEAVWFDPTPAQLRRGARWFRCDLVAFARPGRLFPLPRGRDLHGVLDHPRALRRFGLCGTAAPGTRGFHRVICGRRHSWRAFGTVHLPGGAYPGAAEVRRAGVHVCRRRARAESGGSLRYRYGWEWPSGDQWAAGQHYGYCWVPS
jgi:hypothetical protein